ncbi:MAG: TrpR like protein, YerC/YecD [uncultured bacterium]|nr:MAG: TrpR like protein, YerC/YecD [uncultured bacterium]HBD05624.1 hypothetical protein [Candidatus Uhrbacteria bacterium]
MPRINPNKMSYHLQEELLDDFCSVLSEMRVQAFMKKFIKDLLNRQERIMLLRRLLVAKMLVDGKSYNEIIKELGVGKSTIARISKWVHFGRGGYKIAVRKYYTVQNKKDKK